MKQEYRELVLRVSNEIAREFIKNEKNLTSRALLLDADIAELTRQIGLKTTEIVLEESRDRLVKKNSLKD
jgi:hypothetical protein